ncbi:MAG: sugar phosphate isomerase/epimerase [Chitinophagaceae bacterium]
MNTTRRVFLKNTSLALASASLFAGKLSADSKAAIYMGIQLYSIREDMKKDPRGTLKQLADMGYKYVEHANYVNHKFYGFEAGEFKKILDGLGLKMRSGHTVMGKQHWDTAKKDFTDSWKKTVADAAVVGQKFVISPSLEGDLRKTYDDIKAYMDVFNKSGELCKKSGMKFGYHNHDFEFKESLNDKKVFDIIMEFTDPKLVAQQLDIGNMYGGGGRPLEVLQKYPGRFELLHVKDEIKSEAKDAMSGYESTILGKGIIETKKVIDLAKKQGATDFIIEQESYQGKTPIDCAKEDFAIMKKWGY